MLGLLSMFAVRAGFAQADQDVSVAPIGPRPATVVAADVLEIDGVRVRLWGVR